MSVLSLLAFLVPAAVAKRPDPRDAQIVALEADVDYLRGERDEWHNLALRYRDMVFEDVSKAQHQTNQLMAQNPYFFQANINQQNVQASDFEEFCNCVPARHDLFMPSR